jgi:hypothetical protein
MPTVVLPPVTPFTCHVTTVFSVLPTVGVNVCVLPTSMLTLVGLTATVTGFGQPSVFTAFAGAEEVAAADDTMTSAVSVFPASSVTVRRTV